MINFSQALCHDFNVKVSNLEHDLVQDVWGRFGAPFVWPAKSVQWKTCATLCPLRIFQISFELNNWKTEQEYFGTKTSVHFCHKFKHRRLTSNQRLNFNAEGPNLIPELRDPFAHQVPSVNGIVQSGHLAGDAVAKFLIRNQRQNLIKVKTANLVQQDGTSQYLSSV